MLTAYLAWLDGKLSTYGNTGNSFHLNRLGRRKPPVNVGFAALGTRMQQAALPGSNTALRTRHSAPLFRRQFTYPHPGSVRQN